MGTEQGHAESPQQHGEVEGIGHELDVVGRGQRVHHELAGHEPVEAEAEEEEDRQRDADHHDERGRRDEDGAGQTTAADGGIDGRRSRAHRAPRGRRRLIP